MVDDARGHRRKIYTNKYYLAGTRFVATGTREHNNMRSVKCRRHRFKNVLLFGKCRCERSNRPEPKNGEQSSQIRPELHTLEPGNGKVLMIVLILK